VSLPAADLGSVATRLAEVGIGGAAALLFAQVLFPADPVRIAAGAVRPLLDELASVLEEAARASRTATRSWPPRPCFAARSSTGAAPPRRSASRAR
jgi:uncharacterized membrane protein YgaE (UPF0421/DUF939 family)